MRCHAKHVLQPADRPCLPPTLTLDTGLHLHVILRLLPIYRLLLHLAGHLLQHGVQLGPGQLRLEPVPRPRLAPNVGRRRETTLQAARRLSLAPQPLLLHVVLAGLEHVDDVDHAAAAGDGELDVHLHYALALDTLLGQRVLRLQLPTTGTVRQTVSEGEGGTMVFSPQEHGQ